MDTGNQFLGTERIERLMRQYAVPCIISLLVGALYNIVDQIFIANASYLGSYGNAANTVVFPLTVVALAIAVLDRGRLLCLCQHFPWQTGDGKSETQCGKCGRCWPLRQQSGVDGTVSAFCQPASLPCLAARSMRRHFTMRRSISSILHWAFRFICSGRR